MPHALDDDFLASAIVALAHSRQSPRDARRTVKAAFAILATPTHTDEETRRQLLMLNTVMGFGALAHPEGEA